MRHVIDAQYDGNMHLLIAIESGLPESQIIKAVREAASEFLNSDTKEAKAALQDTCEDFNWGDLITWLPENIAEKHGFKIIDTFVTGLTVDHDENLGP